MAAVLKFNLGIHRCSFMAQGGAVVLAAIGMIYSLAAGLFAVVVAVANAAVLKFGHGEESRRMDGMSASWERALLRPAVGYFR